MNEEVVAYGPFFVVGILLIGYAMLSRRQRAPIDWDVPKVGTFKMDFVAFLITLGVLVASVGLIFKWKGYAETIAQLETNQTATEAEMTTLKSSLDRFKVYELAVALEFPDSVALANNNGSCALPPCLKIETWLKKSGTVDWAPTEGRVAPDPEFSNLVSVHVAGANSGDRVRFKGSLADGSRTWRSEKEIEIPVFHVDMKEPR